jgi:LDH2 family malate/lactate/ureidoglycolate dehydrogenase
MAVPRMHRMDRKGWHPRKRDPADEEIVRVDHVRLGELVHTAALACGLRSQQAGLLAELLVVNDLRGVRSHGAWLMSRYAREIGSGELNPDAAVTVVRETPSSLLLDGGGGLGYFPCYEGTHQLVQKAESQGVAALATRNHGHFGAAGIYARIPLAHDLITFVTSGHQLDLEDGEELHRAGGGSPMAFSAPAGEEEALVLDFGALHGLFRKEERDKIAEIAPGLVLRCIGMGEVCQAWGGLLTGLSMDPAKTPWTWEEANQGSLIICLRIDLFTDSRTFKEEMDEYVRRVRRLEPLPGFDQAYMAGGVEAARIAEYRRDGVPLVGWSRQRLETMADDLGLEVPWDRTPQTPEEKT